VLHDQQLGVNALLYVRLPHRHTDQAVVFALTRLLLCVQSRLPDVSVTKSVSPTSGVLGTVFTYTVSL
jgi:hypothetical protein